MARPRWPGIAGRDLEDLSELADVCIRQALECLYTWLGDGKSASAHRGRHGTAADRAGYGQAGARELNLSSDIDLIFCFAEHGRTDGERPLENEQFFTRVGRQLINVLSKADRRRLRVRVDMRLRPFGDPASGRHLRCDGELLPFAGARLGALCDGQGAPITGDRDEIDP